MFKHTVSFFRTNGIFLSGKKDVKINPFHVRFSYLIISLAVCAYVCVRVQQRIAEQRVRVKVGSRDRAGESGCPTDPLFYFSSDSHSLACNSTFFRPCRLRRRALLLSEKREEGNLVPRPASPAPLHFPCTEQSLSRTKKKKKRQHAMLCLNDFFLGSV